MLYLKIIIKSLDDNSESFGQYQVLSNNEQIYLYLFQWPSSLRLALFKLNDSLSTPTDDSYIL